MLVDRCLQAKPPRAGTVRMETVNAARTKVQIGIDQGKGARPLRLANRFHNEVEGLGLMAVVGRQSE